MREVPLKESFRNLFSLGIDSQVLVADSLTIVETFGF